MMERNTFATSLFIAAPFAEVTSYVAHGMNLDEWTLFSRMQEQVDETTWLGTASGYQRGLYYHLVRRDLGAIQIVEWHCGFELGVYHHVYPMVMFEPAYFGGRDPGTYFHWISFVDPARATPAIAEGIATVHRAEARSLKGHLEKRQGHRAAVPGTLELAAHTVFADAPFEIATAYLADPVNATEWGYMIRRVGDRIVDEYDRSCELVLGAKDCGEYRLIEHATSYADGTVIRAPLLVFPTSYAFARPGEAGVILHRITGWPANGRALGKQTIDEYNAETLASKRILEAKAGNVGSYALGNSYRGRRDA
jgi:hypothetical protein